MVFAEAPVALLGALSEEVRALGFSARLEGGGVRMEGPPGAAQRACLSLRCTSRIFLRAAEFAAKTPAELTRGLSEVSLLPYWNARSGGLTVEVVAEGSSLPASEVRRAAQRVWPRMAKEGRASVRVRLWKSLCAVDVDASGDELYKRGYREETAMAPLRETLAAGLLSLAGFRPELPLWDGLCGSGTLPIEAALRAREMAPGLGRRFAFMSWPSFDGAAWERLCSEAKALPKAPAPIYASDIHAGALGVAKRNAKRAGVAGDIAFERADARRLRPPSGMGTGIFIANLPYGKRVGEGAQLLELYRELGTSLKQNFGGWTIALLFPEGKAYSGALALPAPALHRVANGGLRCTFAVARLSRP